MRLLTTKPRAKFAEQILAALRRHDSTVLIEHEPGTPISADADAFDGLVDFSFLTPGAVVTKHAVDAMRTWAHSLGIGKTIVLLPAGAEGLGSEGEVATLGLNAGETASVDLLLLPESPNVDGSVASLCHALRASVHAQLVADTIEQLVAARETETFHIATDPQPRNGLFQLCKRLVDIALSLGVVLALWWLMLAVWMMVRLQSPGPGIFAQKRVGRGEREFTCYKFRTMHAATPNLGTHEVSIDAVTPIGHILRRTKIDELPQVFNVLKGEMSFVGPRPCLPSQTRLIERRRVRGIFSLVPGITGLAQVAQVDMSDPHRLADWDYRYLKLRTLPMDLGILWRTVLGKGGGDRTGPKGG